MADPEKGTTPSFMDMIMAVFGGMDTMPPLWHAPQRMAWDGDRDRKGAGRERAATHGATHAKSGAAAGRHPQRAGGKHVPAAAARRARVPYAVRKAARRAAWGDALPASAGAEAGAGSGTGAPAGSASASVGGSSPVRPLGSTGAPSGVHGDVELCGAAAPRRPSVEPKLSRLVEVEEDDGSDRDGDHDEVGRGGHAAGAGHSTAGHAGDGVSSTGVGSVPPPLAPRVA